MATATEVEKFAVGDTVFIASRARLATVSGVMSNTVEVEWDEYETSGAIPGVRNVRMTLPASVLRKVVAAPTEAERPDLVAAIQLLRSTGYFVLSPLGG
jgi:hypothetical protein